MTRNDSIVLLPRDGPGYVPRHDPVHECLSERRTAVAHLAAVPPLGDEARRRAARTGAPRPWGARRRAGPRAWPWRPARPGRQQQRAGAAEQPAERRGRGRPAAEKLPDAARRVDQRRLPGTVENGRDAGPHERARHQDAARRRRVRPFVRGPAPGRWRSPAHRIALVQAVDDVPEPVRGEEPRPVADVGVDQLATRGHQGSTRPVPGVLQLVGEAVRARHPGRRASRRGRSEAPGRRTRSDHSA